MNIRHKYVFVTFSVVLALVLVGGAQLGSGAGPDDPYKHLGVFAEVMSRIKSDYVEEPDVKSVSLGALNGMLESLDPYASYLNADQYKQWLKNKDSAKAGVGLVLSKKYGYIGVVDAIPGSPADKAGLGSLDMIETIKGVSTRDMPLAYAELLMQGDLGSTVELSVLRLRKPEPQKVTLTRAAIKAPPVTFRMLQDGIGYVHAQSAENGKAAQVASAIRELEKQGAKKLVLDLRHAAHGVPEEGIALADLFLEKGNITSLQGQKVHKQTFDATAAKTDFRMPLVAITNRGTANGAEIAAAALLDSKRALDVVGERTYGDAAMRKPITLDDGSAVILSVAKYYSPGGKAIQDTGVIPSVQVAEVEQQAAEDDDEAPAAPATPQAAPKPAEDNLLKKAVEILNKGNSAETAAEPTAATAEPKADREKILTPLGVPKP